MKKALILTVGTGTGPDSDIVQPLIKSIRDTRPDRVVLLVTDKSAPHGQRIEAESGLGEMVQAVSIEQPDDVQFVFHRALAALRALRDEGYQAHEIDADYTSGTKAMTAGLVLAAVAFGCATLRYVTGRREHGVVIPGTEQFRVIPPAEVQAEHEVLLAVELLRRFQFQGVRGVLPASRSRLLEGYGARLLESLRALADAYDAWDKFQHGGFIKPYYDADLTMHELGAFRLPKGIPERVQAMHRRTDDRRPPLEKDHLADLWNNAKRRTLEGRYDDAVARLYRLTEMIAQFELYGKHGVNTADVHPEQLPLSPEYRERLERLRRNGDPKGKIQTGLQQDYELLQELGSELGATVLSRGKLGNLLAKRNTSILAHGQSPETKDDAEDLAEEVAALAEVVVPDFQARCAALQFPWLVHTHA